MALTASVPVAVAMLMTFLVTFAVPGACDWSAHECTGEVCVDGLLNRLWIHTCDELYPGVGNVVGRTAADTADNDDINLLLLECISNLTALGVRRHGMGRLLSDGARLFINNEEREFAGMSEMREQHAVL